MPYDPVNAPHATAWLRELHRHGRVQPKQVTEDRNVLIPKSWPNAAQLALIPSRWQIWSDIRNSDICLRDPRTGMEYRTSNMEDAIRITREVEEAVHRQLEKARAAHGETS